MDNIKDNEITSNKVIRNIQLHLLCNLELKRPYDLIYGMLEHLLGGLMIAHVERFIDYYNGTHRFIRYSTDIDTLIIEHDRLLNVFICDYNLEYTEVKKIIEYYMLLKYDLKAKQVISINL